LPAASSRTPSIALHQALSLAKFSNHPIQLWKTHRAAGDYYTKIGRREKGQAACKAARDVVDRIKGSLENEDLRNRLESLSPIS
jgi:hypothetical protein